MERFAWHLRRSTPTSSAMLGGRLNGRLLSGLVVAVALATGVATSARAASAIPDTCSPHHVAYTFDASNNYSSGWYTKTADGCAQPWMVAGQSHSFQATWWEGNQEFFSPNEDCKGGQTCNFPTVPNGYPFQIFESDGNFIKTGSNIYY
jgi:hypothetical protein